MEEQQVEIRELLKMVLNEFEEMRSTMGSVDFYTAMAVKLGNLVGESWSWRYVQGVEKGTVGAGRKFGEAVRRLAEVVDGRRAEMTGMVPVRVLAREGQVREGSVILGGSRVCDGGSCQVVFVPRVPWQRFCSKECRRSRWGR